MAAYICNMTKEFWDEYDNLQQSTRVQTRKVVTKFTDDPWSPDLQSEKIHAAEPGVHSSRVNDSYRLIWKFIKPNNIILCLVDQHDTAYRRAARKSFTLEDGVIGVRDILKVGAATWSAHGNLFGKANNPDNSIGDLFRGYLDAEILAMGVSEEVLPQIRSCDNLHQFEAVERLVSPEVFDKLFAMAEGEVVRPVVSDTKLSISLEENKGGEDIYRFVDEDDFKRVLDGTLEEWMLFLAPHQKALVYRNNNGPSRIKGVAGSGKTVVALHRAYYLTKVFKKQDEKILFLTYGNRLPEVNRHLLKQLIGQDSKSLDRIECLTIHQFCSRLLRSSGLRFGVNPEESKNLLQSALAEVRSKIEKNVSIARKDVDFFSDEIQYAIKGRDVRTEEEYLALDRSGRGTRLGGDERCFVWGVYTEFQRLMKSKHLLDYEDFIPQAITCVQAGGLKEQYAAAIVDEIQDLTEATMKLIRMIIPPGPNDLFLVGDGLQRIYPGGYNLGQIGIDITGRGTLLRKNYRNTQQILRAAHAMMENIQYDDMDDDLIDLQTPEYSVRSGRIPELRGFKSSEIELAWVSKEIEKLIAKGKYHEKDIAVIYRSSNPYESLIQNVIGKSLSTVKLSKDSNTYFGPGIKNSTFHSVKGLEFKVVFVVGVTDGWLVPKDSWDLGEESLDEYLQRERRLLYVAMTRARDLLYLSYARGVPSRFLNVVPESIIKRVN